MYNRSDLRAELARDEAYKLKAYQDTLGNWTIGIGHLLGDRPRMTEITPAEAEALFDSDVTRAEWVASSWFPNWKYMDDIRQRAFINMCFNLGSRIGSFVKFIAAMERLNWKEATIEMLDSLWARQVGDRAKRLAIMIEKGRLHE